MDTANNPVVRVPWNKGKLVGQKAPLRLRDIWLFASGFSYHSAFETWHCSISRSTASSGPAIW